MREISNNLVWMDLEMTGLDPDRERIIEIATIITTGELEIIEQGPDIIIHQPDELLDAMDDWNRKHHKASGLTRAVRESTISTLEAEETTLAFIAKHCPQGSTPLAGNSIHQDRAFLSRYMPKLNGWLHYRNVDVSTLKELVRRWHPEIAQNTPKKKGDHRALGDVLESLEELRYYRRSLFPAR